MGDMLALYQKAGKAAMSNHLRLSLRMLPAAASFTVFVDFHFQLNSSQRSILLTTAGFPDWPTGWWNNLLLMNSSRADHQFEILCSLDAVEDMLEEILDLLRDERRREVGY